MDLLVGATGFLGMEISRRLQQRGRAVRALVRPGAASDRVQLLASRGQELVQGDLKAPTSLQAACRGVDVVVSTASATLSRQPGDSLDSVDLRGQLALVDAAREAQVRRFVFISFPPMSVDCPLQQAKRTVEQHLRESGLSYTILQPVNFMEIWLGPALGFDPVHGRARVFGTGQRPVSWISLLDVAAVASAAADGPAFADRVLPLGGPDALGALEVVALFEQLGAPKVAVELVPESALEAQLAAATDPLDRTMAALCLSTARGWTVDPGPVRDLAPGPLTSVRDHARRVLGR
jgi:uncharacterized protein YbjT (DUF2867 family)